MGLKEFIGQRWRSEDQSQEGSEQPLMHQGGGQGAISVEASRSGEMLHSDSQQGPEDLRPTTTMNWILPTTCTRLEADHCPDPIAGDRARSPP